jgi:hypothetical protein
MMKYFWILGVLFCGLAHAEAPRCNPGDYSPTVNWQVGVSTDESIVSILWCNDSAGLTWWGAGWNPRDAPVNACAGNIKSQSSTMLLTAFWAHCLSSSATLTAPQQAAVDRLVRRWLPKLETSKDVPVYRYASGALAGQSIGTSAANITCGSTVVATDAHGVDYYDVSGQHYDNDTVIPPDSAAACTLLTPPEIGW